MNIFYLHEDPGESARIQCDKHVIKMIVESAQMLSTAHRVLDGHETKRVSKSGKRMIKYWDHPTLDNVLYKATHSNHPSNVWIREGHNNYYWLLEHFYALGSEYTFRYGKEHTTINKLGAVLRAHPKNIPYGSSPIKLAMPDRFICDDPVKSYRDYYQSKEIDMRWTRRHRPTWYK